MKNLYIYMPSDSIDIELFWKAWFMDHQEKRTGRDSVFYRTPEESLTHPRLRVEFARSLVKKLRYHDVELVTGDDYIIREISNLIMLDTISDEGFKTTKIKELKKDKMSIPYDCVKAYEIDEGEDDRSYKIKEIKVDRCKGIIAHTFDDVIDTQNEYQSLLYCQILKELSNG